MAHTVAVFIEGEELTTVLGGDKGNNINALKKKGIGFLVTEDKLSASRCLLEAIIDGDKIGFIDKNASVIIEPQYDAIKGDFLTTDSLVCVLKEEKWGAINSSGDVVIPLEYKELYRFCCGLACARKHNYQYGYIDFKNEEVVPFGLYEWVDPTYLEQRPYNTGYARVKQNGKWGIVNNLGEVVIEIKYDKIWTLKSEYLSDIHAEIEGRTESIDLISKTINSPKSKVTFRKRSIMHKPKYEEYNGSYAQDVMGYSDDTINDAFEGDPDAYWNID